MCPVYVKVTTLIGGNILLRAYAINSVMVDFLICVAETNIAAAIKEKWNVVFYESK